MLDRIHSFLTFSPGASEPAAGVCDSPGSSSLRETGVNSRGLREGASQIFALHLLFSLDFINYTSHEALRAWFGVKAALKLVSNSKS